MHRYLAKVVRTSTVVRVGLLIAFVGFAGGAHAAVRYGNTSEGEEYAFVDYPVFDLGGSYGGLQKTGINHFRYYPDGMQFDTFVGPMTALPADELQLPSDFFSDLYGDCVVPDPVVEYQQSPTCELPLEVQSWPTCMRNVSQYSQPIVATPLVVRGAPALLFDEGRQLEIYTGNMTVVIYGQDRQVVQGAANQLVMVNEAAIRIGPEGPSSGWSLFFSLGILPAPAPGAMTGTLPCHVSWSGT